jgi:hypothetical protein
MLYLKNKMQCSIFWRKQCKLDGKAKMQNNIRIGPYCKTFSEPAFNIIQIVIICKYKHNILIKIHIV